MTTLNPVSPRINASLPWGVSTESTLVNTLIPTNLNQSQKGIRDSFVNATGVYLEDDGDNMLNDIQTVILACIATLAPLVLTLFTAFGIRLLYIQYKTRRKDPCPYDGILLRENTSSSSIPRPLHSHLLTEKGCVESHLALNVTDSVEICSDSQSNEQNRSNNVNGSIITMTLKNNHLIVETEERNDIEEDSRETTMRYSPSTRDGVFVVEVQQGVRRSPGSGGSTSFAEPERSGSVIDQCALVHNPPEKYSDEETRDNSECYTETISPQRSSPDPATRSKTGLSQSNTSLSSLHQSYCYTTQQCYDHGSYGYNIYCGYGNISSVKRLVVDNKPKITSALYKTSCLKGKSVSLDLPNKLGNDKAVLAQNPSLDNVLESNGLEDFTTSNLYKSIERENILVDSNLEMEEKINPNNNDRGGKKK